MPWASFFESCVALLLRGGRKSFAQWIVNWFSLNLLATLEQLLLNLPLLWQKLALLHTYALAVSSAKSTISCAIVVVYVATHLLLDLLNWLRRFFSYELTILLLALLIAVLEVLVDRDNILIRSNGVWTYHRASSIRNLNWSLLKQVWVRLAANLLIALILRCLDW